MNKKVVVIDYGIGNLLSVSRGIESCGAFVTLTNDVDKVSNADYLVLPGVGAFADGMNGLKERNLIDAIHNFVGKERPFLGICLGMQMLMDTSEEFGDNKGLGLIAGKVKPIPDTIENGEPHKIPHISWNTLKKPADNPNWNNTILNGIEENVECYFVHSFTPVPDDNKYRLADSDYNGRLISAVIKSGSLYGCQFHPEKGGTVGLKILENFCTL